jgi:HD-like signal output (HDOD) protein
MVNGQVIELFSLPEIHLQLSKMLDNPRYSAQDYVQVISKDPALCVRLLRIVNSSYYPFPSRIDTISRAVSVVGIEDLKNLVLATSAVNSFDKIPDDLVDMTSFWLRSVNCAVIAKLLAIKCSVLHCERLFIAGLLEDLGSLVLYFQFPEECKKILEEAKYDRHRIIELENQVIGFNHVDVGVELLRLWELPDSLSVCLTYYRHPEQAKDYILDAYILNLATILTDSFSQPEQTQDSYSKIPEATLKMLKLNKHDIDQILEQSKEDFSQVFTMVAPSTPSTVV